MRISDWSSDVCSSDLLIIQGKYQLKAQPPFVPGAGVTGTVLEVGEKVQHIKAGDAVAALINVGGVAEEAVASAAFCMPLPPGLALAEAARSEEHPSDLQSLMRISSAVFGLKKK